MRMSAACYALVPIEAQRTSSIFPARLHVGDRRDVGVHHVLDELVEARLGSPAELGSRLARIAEETIDLGRPEIARIDLDEHLAGRLLDALLRGSTAAPDDVPADMAESLLDEFAHRVALAGREHIVVGPVLLQDQPHALDEFARMSPVPHGIEVSEEQFLLQPALDRRHCPRDLARDEGFASDRALVIEQDAARGM